MAIAPKIKHVDQRPNGVLRFRRRFPKDVAEHLGQSNLQVHIRNTSGIAFHQEYQAILSDFDRIVAQARAELDGKDTRAPIERWHEALLKAEGLVAETSGLEDDPVFARHEIAKGLTQRHGTDPLLIKALANPEADPPEVSVQDAANRYAKDKRVEDSRKTATDFERICRRLTNALGSLDKVPLKSLRREHGRKFMDTLLSTKKADGSSLSLGSAKREAVIVTAIINHGIREFDIDGVSNPFSALPWPKQDTLAVEKKLPLEDAHVVAVSDRLSEDLKPLWSVLAGTGMRLSEAVGLLREDIVLDAPIPHAVIRPNAIRRIKTTSSQRTVPLVGEALKAVTKIIEGVEHSEGIFPRYARSRGADAASAALMKHLRQETSDSRHSVHGLRHRVSDKLRESGAPTEVRHGFLGHANEAIAESTYGGREARLREFQKWAEKAGL